MICIIPHGVCSRCYTRAYMFESCTSSRIMSFFKAYTRAWEGVYSHARSGSLARHNPIKLESSVDFGVPYWFSG